MVNSGKKVRFFENVNFEGCIIDDHLGRIDNGAKWKHVSRN